MNKQVRDPLIQQFVAYIQRRGVPEHFHELYRSEAAVILSLAGVSSLEQLSHDRLAASVRDAERRLQNRKAVCAALEAFLAYRAKEPSHDDSDDSDDSDDEGRDSIDRSPAVAHPAGNEHRRYVRVPFNREVDVVGSLGGNRASDISIGGIYLETRSAWTSGDFIDLNFRLRPADPGPLHMRARVVYVDPGVGVGLDFIDVDHKTRTAIRHYVEETISRREHARS